MTPEALQQVLRGCRADLTPELTWLLRPCNKYYLGAELTWLLNWPDPWGLATSTAWAPNWPDSWVDLTPQPTWTLRCPDPCCRNSCDVSTLVYIYIYIYIYIRAYLWPTTEWVYSRSERLGPSKEAHRRFQPPSRGAVSNQGMYSFGGPIFRFSHSRRSESQISTL